MNIELSDANYIEIIGSLIGVAIIVVGNALSAKRKKIMATGIKAEGVVFAMEKKLVVPLVTGIIYIHQLSGL